jgi:Putative adhesin
MISRSTLIGALVVVELGIVGMAVKAIAGDTATTAGSSRSGPGHFWGFSSSIVVPERLDRTFPAGLTPHVVIDVHDADVAIDAAPQPVVHAVEDTSVAGYVSGSIPALTASGGPDGVRISAGSGGVNVIVGEYSRKLRVTVPEGAHVEVLSAGRIDATGLRAKLIAHTPDGSIHVRDHRGDLDVSSDSGRIELVDVQGEDVAANTHDGRLYFTRVGAERINGHTNFGRIYAVDLRVKDGALNTHSGRISASFTANSDATVKVSTGDGKVTVAGLPSAPDGTDKRTVQLGAGRGNFEVSTDEGAVNISQGANV